jgi:O-antigen/teichoic acid export membrane protein
MNGSGEIGAEKESITVRISGGLLVRNTFINLIAQTMPLLVAMIAIPFVVRGMGTERFGLLSMAWVVMGYFTIFDLGLGRATTKYVAEALGRDEGSQISQIIWTAVTFQAILGFAGAIALLGMTDVLVGSVLKIPPQLLGEARDTFHLLAFAIPVVLVSSSFSGVMEAAQRFDLENAVKIPSSTLTYLLPLVGLSLGFGLPGIVILILLARFGALLAFMVMSHIFVSKLGGYSISFRLFACLFAYGGWVTISNIVSPVLVYLDRILIGSLITIAAVAYYTAPFEAVTRLSIISTSLTTTLFPAFSSLNGVSDKQKLGIIFGRSIKYILLATGPIVIVIILFAKEILQIWLGSDFATESTVVMQVLAFGILINLLAYAPFALLQGIGRPDLPAKFHLIELIIYVGLAWISVSEFGIDGAAKAWTVRVALDALLLFWAAFKVCRFSPRLLAENGTTLAVFELMMLAATECGLKAVAYSLPLLVQSSLVVGLLGAFAFFAWKYVLDNLDRKVVLEVVNLKKILASIS